MSCTLAPPASASGRFNRDTIEISWSAVAGAFAYRVVITDKTSVQQFFSGDITGNSVHVPNANPAHDYSYSIKCMCSVSEVSSDGIIDDVVHSAPPGVQ
jgi:hypothetical protein